MTTGFALQEEAFVALQTSRTAPRPAGRRPAPQGRAVRRARARTVPVRSTVRVPARTPAVRSHPAIISRAKRAIDVALSAVLLVAVAPLLLVLMTLIRLTSPGPSIFVQERVGHGGKPFRMYKLRTMVHGCAQRQEELARAAGGAVFCTIRNDPRLTPPGRFLRKFSLDELPQLYNVLRGDMSLVGPRPLVSNEMRRLGAHHSRRSWVKPGITGLWQVSGRNACPDEKRIRLDLDYVEEWSIWLDLRILLRTIPVALSGAGVAL